jgi:NAD(P)-dependent dehydrogenase (short-subunit alcohol dehydrogenase family)
LDLSDLGSVRSFTENFAAAEARLDMLVLNAGIMVPPYGRTKDGFELQFGTNHLGHFALAARLFPLVRATRDARVVTVTSVAQRAGTVEFADLHWERRAYKPWGAYGQSKLANMLFGAELGRRIDAANARGATITARSTLAQPGWTSTDFQRTTWLVRMLNPLFGMSPPEGALSTLRAACDPNAAQGSYWGPGGWMEARGAPQPARVAPRIADRAVAERLWSVSEELVGTSIDLAPSLGAPVHKAA